MLAIVLDLMRKKKVLLPFLVLSIVLLFMAFFDFWYGSSQRQLSGKELISFLCSRAFQSHLMALFFIIWMVQLQVQHTVSGFYKMLLIFGWSRQKLFLYQVVQCCIHSAGFMALNFVCYAILGVFYAVYPWDFILQTDVNAFISQFLYLFLLGSFSMLIGSIKTSYVIILPVFMYWLLEGWIGNFLKRQFESSLGDFLPLQAMSRLIGESLLNLSQVIAISLYSLVLLILLNLSIQKKMFV